MSAKIMRSSHGRFTVSRLREDVRGTLCGTYSASKVVSIDRPRSSSSQSADVKTDADNTSNFLASTLIGQRARQKQADKEFFADLLSSAATKRDAKAYISRLKNPTGSKPSRTKSSAPSTTTKTPVNLGTLFAQPRSVEASPVFSQYTLEQKAVEEQEILHIALVKLSDVGKMSETLLHGIAQTLSQLARLSMAPCVVVEIADHETENARQQLVEDANRLAAAIDAISDVGPRVVDNCMTVLDSGKTEVSLRKMLMRPLRHGRIPIIVPIAYSESQQHAVVLPSADAIMTLAKEFSESSDRSSRDLQPRADRTLLDRIIFIDEAGGIPSSTASDGKHVFINLKQEYPNLEQELRQSSSIHSSRHLSNLSLLKEVLTTLPPSSSGLMATPFEAANSTPEGQDSSSPSSVGTRRRKNALIHNLLTDKPAFSSSLPRTRLSRSPSQATNPGAVATFIKHGMPVSISPNPEVHAWTSTGPHIKLTDSSIDLDKLTFLINDSFNRELHVPDYLGRVNDCLAGVIIAGDYEGGAILTWETPEGASPTDKNRLVPYLDKFAVLKRSQGAGGVADIVFNAMVRSCFPDGVCWRSRKDNPVNKWYFERSRGTWKIPGMNWTMFWTTPGVAASSEDLLFKDYESVCKAVIPTWVDKKKAAD